MADLRVTDTNSTNDSRGRAFGLEGNDFIYVLIGFVVAMGLYLGCTMILRIHILPALAIALPVFLAPAAWVVFLRHNKPAGYAEDWFEQLVNREGWTLSSGTQPETEWRSHEHPTA